MSPIAWPEPSSSQPGLAAARHRRARPTTIRRVPITLLVPFPPGGSADTVIRPVAQKVADNMKATFVIDNRPGGGGNVAAQATKAAAPDGYTLFLTNMGVMSVNPMLYPEMHFDPVNDFRRSRRSSRSRTSWWCRPTAR